MTSAKPRYLQSGWHSPAGSRHASRHGCCVRMQHVSNACCKKTHFLEEGGSGRRGRNGLDRPSDGSCLMHVSMHAEALFWASPAFCFPEGWAFGARSLCGLGSSVCRTRSVHYSAGKAQRFGQGCRTRGLTASQQNTRRFRRIGVYPTPETLNRFQSFLGSTAKLRARLQDYCGPDRVAGDGERFLRTPLSLHQRQAPIGILRSRPKENISAWAACTL